MPNLTPKQKMALENASETEWKKSWELVQNTRTSAATTIVKSLMHKGLLEHKTDYSYSRAIYDVYRLTAEGVKARNGEKVTTAKQHDFTVGQTVEYRDWGWVQTEHGKRQWGMIWTEVEIVKLHAVRLEIKFPNGIVQRCEAKNLRAIEREGRR